MQRVGIRTILNRFIITIILSFTPFLSFVKGNKAMTFTITSTAFNNDAAIPKEYTGEGTDMSPALSWSGAPAATKSFALICDDPDAPVGLFTHWTAWDIPATLTSLPSGEKQGKAIGHGIKQGKTSFGNIGYQGPMPPKGHGRHRYFFTLYALDTSTLNLPEGASRADLDKALHGHSIAQTQLMGTYERK